MRGFGLPEAIAAMGLFTMVPLAVLLIVYLVQRLRTQERLRAIEKGIPIPSAGPRERAARTRKWGIVLIATGLGVLVLFSADGDPEGMAMSAIPSFIGIGLLLEYWLTMRDLRRNRE